MNTLSKVPITLNAIPKSPISHVQSLTAKNEALSPSITENLVISENGREYVNLDSHAGSEVDSSCVISENIIKLDDTKFPSSNVHEREELLNTTKINDICGTTLSEIIGSDTLSTFEPACEPSTGFTYAPALSEKKEPTPIKKKKQFTKQPDLQLPPGIDKIIGQMKAPMTGVENMMKSAEIEEREQFESDVKFQKSLFSMKL
jgi:hypothetical protein